MLSPGFVESDPVAMLPWYAVRVRTRSEVLVDRILKGKGFESYVPTYRARRIWSDRVRTVDSPLYPGYVFCRFEFERRLPILQSIGVLEVVNDGRKGLPIPEQEVQAIRTILKSQLEVSPWPYLRVGEKVEIHRGPLRGIEGILLSQKKNFRLVVSIPLLQRSVRVEIEGDWVRPLHSTIASPSRLSFTVPALREVATG